MRILVTRPQDQVTAAIVLSWLMSLTMGRDDRVYESLELDRKRENFCSEQSTHKLAARTVLARIMLLVMNQKMLFGKMIVFFSFGESSRLVTFLSRTSCTQG